MHIICINLYVDVVIYRIPFPVCFISRNNITNYYASSFWVDCFFFIDFSLLIANTYIIELTIKQYFVVNILIHLGLIKRKMGGGKQMKVTKK